MVAPAVAMLIAAGVAAAAKGASDYFGAQTNKKMAKRRAKEMERETQAGLLQDTLQRGVELEEHRLKGRQKLGKRKSQSMQDTADLVRGALNI